MNGGLRNRKGGSNQRGLLEESEGPCPYQRCRIKHLKNTEVIRFLRGGRGEPGELGNSTNGGACMEEQRWGGEAPSEVIKLILAG